MVTPLSWLAERIELGPRALRWGATAALVASVLIVLTGGVVRVTGSGLGCPTWPACSETEIIAPISADIHQVIEQTNRLLTGVLIVAVGWVIVAARLQRPRDRRITRLAWSQFWLVVANAVVGGLSVLAGLNPWIVAGHFLMAIALLTTTALTWHVVHRDPDAVIVTTPAARGLAWALAALTAVIVVVGTLVSGSGPHSGDSSDVPRMPFEWAGITVVHGVLGSLALVVALVLLALLRGPGARVPRLRVILFLVVVALQAVLGLVQALTHLPEALVALHLLGAALVWVGALRVLLDADTRLLRAGSSPYVQPERAAAR